jgi:hypothetical protein
MHALIPLALFYDPVKSIWHFYSKERAFTPKHQTLYWGVPLTPINLNAHNELLAPPGALKMKAMVAPGKQAVLGPLIGILSAEKRDGSLKGNFANFKAIMETGQKIGGIVFAFTPSNVDWNKKIIHGNIFDKNKNQWVTCPFPFPNVVYNRIQDWAHEIKKNSQSCIQQFLSHPGITLYNRGFFNKKDFISTLSKSPKLHKHIPETNQLISKADLTNMFKRYEALYLKPTNSSKGTGIIRVRKSQSQKLYTMQYYAHNKKLKKYRTNNINQLWNKIQQQMIRCPYIVQQAIPLATVSTCPFDCRVLVQKNHQGLWQISGLGIRVAGNAQSITTHVPRGGRIASPTCVLQQAFPQQNSTQIEQQVHSLCIAIAKQMEKHHHLLGEMSIDMGLDRNGYPWIFEANSKPMKFDEPEIRKKQLEQTIHYAQFLTF